MIGPQFLAGRRLVDLSIWPRRLNGAISPKTSRVSAFVCPQMTPRHLAAVAYAPLGQLSEYLFSYVIPYSEVVGESCKGRQELKQLKEAICKRVTAELEVGEWMKNSQESVMCRVNVMRQLPEALVSVDPL